MKHAFLLSAVALAGPAVFAQRQRESGSPKESRETRYLAFQIFTGASDPRSAIGDSGLQPLSPIPTLDQLDAFVRDIVHRIGTVGERRTHLAVIFGPLAFDNSDDEIRRLVSTAFTIARRQNVAVGFHVDDSMFWARRRDLWSDSRNVEWMDWKGTPSTGRRIDWSPQPKELPPQMCFNSPAVQAEVRRRATNVIGKAIENDVARLKKEGREDLFAGVIAGWETQIGQDFTTNRFLGYHALANRGFTAARPPRDPDEERSSVVQEFITLWCEGFVDAGISPDKLYSHTAFLTRRIFDGEPTHAMPYAQYNHFAPPSVAFGKYRRPGFSTYPEPGRFDQIDADMAARGRPAWASSEGTNLQLGSAPGQSGMNMETYLAKMFNHGATLVNIYSWGLGGEAMKNMDFRIVTEGEEALRAYRMFLNGGRLVESATVSTLMERLPAKIHRIQRELPVWIRKTGKQALAEPLMNQLDGALKANDLARAEAIADRILQLLRPQ